MRHLFTIPCGRPALISAVVFFLGMGILFARPASGTSQEPDNQKGKRPISQAELLERFDRLTPAARLEKIQLLTIHKLAKIDNEFQPAVRKDLVVILQERGSLEGAQVSDVICGVKSKNTSGVATTIKWLIEDGSQVKKGDKLVELDDSVLQDELREQKISLDNALEEKTRAAENLKLQRLSNKVDVRFAEIDARMAELDLKKFSGKDPIEKELLELRLERARLVVEKTKAQAKAQDRQMMSDLRLKEAVANLHATKLREIEKEIAKCRLVAPQDGLAIYYLPESTRGGFGRQALVAVGESVREGHKLVQVCEPGHWNVQTRVHEARISEVRAGQKAYIQVDAFPDKLLPGKVLQIAPLAAPQDWLSADVKLYPLLVSLLDNLPALKPGMSATVAIEVGRKADVVQVPVQAVVRSGKDSYCYVSRSARRFKSGRW
jgi:multidrug efflux pump subunit AcrA (membrane-fusion protein)